MPKHNQGTAMKINCQCQHAYQDSLYGPGVRIANPSPTSEKQPTVDVRCTVCSAVQSVPKSRLNEKAPS
jgi:hypothetical protein